MAPLHHHFELKEWPEPRIVVRFWIIAFMLVLGRLVNVETAMSMSPTMVVGLGDTGVSVIRHLSLKDSAVSVCDSRLGKRTKEVPHLAEVRRDYPGRLRGATPSICSSGGTSEESSR